MDRFPLEIQRHIYEFDSTYRCIFNDIIRRDIPNYRLVHHPLYPYLTQLFVDIGYDYDNAMYYFTDATGQAQMSFIDDNLNHITDNFVPDGPIITYQGTDITYLLEPYMTDSDSDSDYMDTSDGDY